GKYAVSVGDPCLGIATDPLGKGNWKSRCYLCYENACVEFFNRLKRYFALYRQRRFFTHIYLGYFSTACRGDYLWYHVGLFTAGRTYPGACFDINGICSYVYPVPYRVGTGG